MRLKDFDYELPKNLIAQEPVKPRDHSRLLVVTTNATNRASELLHKHFYDLPDYLNKGDILVLNNSKVFPARLIGKKAETGGRIEVFLLKKEDLTPTPAYRTGRLSLARRGSKGDVWQCLLGGKGRKEGLKVEFGKNLKAEVIKNNNDGTWEVAFNLVGKKFMGIVNKIGRMPLPPYIKRSNPSTSLRFTQDGQNYQTVYADDKKVGSVAAPTAGLHFTPRLLKELKKKGARIEYVTLHVGLGTFAPVKVGDIKKHKMHAEWAEIKKETINNILKAKREEKRVVAVGTTSARVLESAFNLSLRGAISDEAILNTGCDKKTIKDRHAPYRSLAMTKNSLSFYTDIFIYPGYKFKIIDGLITNFHLPKSTLLMLVSAFAGKDNIDKAYKEAIKKKYRFYSYGDAMLII